MTCYCKGFFMCNEANGIFIKELYQIIFTYFIFKLVSLCFGFHCLDETKVLLQI